MNPADLILGGDKLQEAHHLNGMGSVCEKRGEYQDAQRLYEEAMALYEETFGSQHMTVALVARNLARVLRVQNKPAEAALMEEHADAIFAQRGEPVDDGPIPFGGSAGFFALLGWDKSATESETESEQEVIPENDAESVTVQPASLPLAASSGAIDFSPGRSTNDV